MKIATRVKRYQTIVLWFIVGLLAISLVFWGNVPGEGKDRSAVAGVIFGDTEIRWEEYSAVRNVIGPLILFDRYKSLAGGNWQMFTRYADAIIGGRFRFPDPDDETANKETWKYLVALHVAEEIGIAVGENELHQEIETFCLPLGVIEPRTRQIDMAHYAYVVSGLFRTNVATFENAFRKYITVEKLVDLASEAEIPSYESAFQAVLRKKRKAKIRYAEFKPEDFRAELTAVSEAAVAKFYKDNLDAKDNPNARQHEAHLKDPKKAVVEYLMASFEALKEKTTDPTEDEMRKYYDDNKSTFEIIEEKKPEETHDHAKDEKLHADEKKDEEKKFKPFAEVKDDIKNRIKLKLAENLAYDLIRKVRDVVGEAIDKAKPGETIDLGPIAEASAPVRHDSLVVAERRVNEAEDVLGSGSGIEHNCFVALHDGGYADIVKTTKGFILYRLNKTIEPKVRPLASEDVREYIEKELKKQQMKDIARRKAQDASNEINRVGISRAAKAQALAFKTSDFFDESEANRIGTFARFAFTPTLNIGQSTISDDSAGGKTWLIYLEDVVDPPAADVGKEFHEMWKDTLRRSKYRYEAEWFRVGSNRALFDNYLQQLMKEAKLIDKVMKVKDAGEEKKEAPGNAPIEEETP